MLHPGLYEQVINNALDRELSEIPAARKSTAPIDTAEASKVLAQYLTEVVQKGLDNVQDNGGGIEAQIELANQIVSTTEYDYPAFHLSMDCFWCEVLSGDLVLKEAEAARWLTKDELDSVQWLPADQSILEKIREMMK